MSDATTRGVRVQVQSSYVPERSSPRDSQYFFAYRIRITNAGDETVQLVSRHWVITDGNGDVEHVQGPGVVGEQPVLAPGQSFEYTSFCPLTTADRLDAGHLSDGHGQRRALRRADRPVLARGTERPELTPQRFAGERESLRNRPSPASLRSGSPFRSQSYPSVPKSFFRFQSHPSVQSLPSVSRA